MRGLWLINLGFQNLPKLESLTYIQSRMHVLLKYFIALLVSDTT